MKQRRIKKLVKGHLNKIENDGDASFPTKQDKIDQLAALNAMSNADLITALGISNAGKPGLEVINIDGDAAGADAFPFDAREVADADRDGVGNNREIVDLHIKLLALAADDAIAQAAQDAAAAQVVIIDAQLALMQFHQDGQGINESLEDYNTALGLFNAAVSTLETIRADAAAKHAEAVAAEAAIAALPEPAAGIKYTIDNVEYTAKDCFDNRAVTLQSVSDELAAVDVDAAFANGRVADGQRTDADATTVPDPNN